MGIEPYYEDESVTLYHGDCREVLPTLGVFDLLLTDPPYGVSYKSNKNDNHIAIAGDESQQIALEALVLSSKNLRAYRHLYVFGKFDLPEPFTAQCELIWDKQLMGMGDLSLPWSAQHEPIQFGAYVPGKASRERGSCRLSARLRKGSVLRCKRTNGTATRRHPTEKPVDILRQMIESSTMLGESVLDPFCGVGSTLVAAVKEDRKAVGIELEEKYCEIAADRLRRGDE